MYLCIHACMCMDAHIHIFVKRISLHPTLGANGNKKDCENWSNEIYRYFKNSDCKKKCESAFLTKRQVSQLFVWQKTKIYNLLKDFCQKKLKRWKFRNFSKPRSWKLCIEGGPCELMRLQKQKLPGKLHKTNMVNHGGKILISKSPMVVGIIYSLLHFQFWLLDLSHFHV